VWGGAGLAARAWSCEQVVRASALVRWPSDWLTTSTNQCVARQQFGSSFARLPARLPIKFDAEIPKKPSLVNFLQLCNLPMRWRDGIHQLVEAQCGRSFPACRNLFNANHI